MTARWSSILFRVTIVFLLLGLLLGGTGGQDKVIAGYVSGGHSSSPSSSTFNGQDNMRPLTEPEVFELYPAQFIAKMFTEGLGRTPLQPEWNQWAWYFRNNGCNADRLRVMIQAIYTDPVYGFADLYYTYYYGQDRAAMLLALFRGALNREPDATGFATLLAYSYNHTWPEVVSHFLASQPWLGEFNALASDICDNGDGEFYQDAPYGWDKYEGPHLPLTPEDMPLGYCGALPPYVFDANDEDALQAQLYNPPNPNNTVYLAQKLVVEITHELIIPEGVTLTTCELPGQQILPVRYALMGRLVRGAAYYDPIVSIQGSSQLRGVWVDGLKTRWGSNPTNPEDLGNTKSVEIRGGSESNSPIVTNNRLSDPWGWTNLVAWVNPCGEVYIANNLVTGYANDHYRDGWWADGISVACERTTVVGNQIVDASDLGIVVFQSGPDYVQQSLVQGNRILNAGNPAFGGLGADPLGYRGYPWEDPPGTVYNFSHVDFRDNVLWTSRTSHLGIAFWVGSRALFGPNAYIGADIPHDPPLPGADWSVSFVGNTTKESPQLSDTCDNCWMRVNTPILVSGMRDALIWQNDLEHVVTYAYNTCPIPPAGTLVMASVCCPPPEGTWASFCWMCPVQTYVDSGQEINKCIVEDGPFSGVASLFPALNATSFLVSWSGGHFEGLDIASFDIQYRDGTEGSWTGWLSQTTAMSTTFDLGQEGHTYYFRSRAHDSNGLLEDWPADYDTFTTVDITAPSSQVAALPTYSSGTFTVSWSGNDTISGLQDFDIQACQSDCGFQGSGWSDWLTHTTAISHSFSGENAVTYSFRSRARDGAGNVEPWPASADATTTVDTQPPETAVNTLPMYTSQTSFAVSWQGSDALSGLHHYNLYYREESAANWVAWLTNVTNTQSTFNGTRGYTYHFCSQGVDNLGNAEACPPSAAGWPIQSDAHTGVTPWSRVNDLPAETSGNTIHVTWSGAPGLQVVYDVQVRDGLYGTWQNWKSGVTYTAANYTGQYGHIYYFRSRQRAGGIWEVYPFDYDTYTKLIDLSLGGLVPPSAPLTTPPDEAPDRMEDVTQTQMLGTLTGYIASVGDVDWYRFELTETMRLRIQLADLPADFDLYVFAGDGRFLWASTWGRTLPEAVVARVPAGVYYVQLVGYAGAWSDETPYRLLAERVTQ